MGVKPRSFTPNELKNSYRQLSRQYHPDKNPSPDAAEMFQTIKNGKRA